MELSYSLSVYTLTLHKLDLYVEKFIKRLIFVSLLFKDCMLIILIKILNICLIKVTTNSVLIMHSKYHIH